MTNKNDAIPQVSLVAYEVAQERARRTIRGLLLGWAISIAALAIPVVIALAA